MSQHRERNFLGDLTSKLLKKDQGKVEATLSQQEMEWLQNISRTSITEQVEAEAISSQDLSQALQEISAYRPIEIDKHTSQLLKHVGVSRQTLQEITQLLEKYTYNKPLKVLRRLTEFPVIIGDNKKGEKVAVLPEYHDAQGAGDNEYIYNNCSTLSKQFAFQLHVRGIIDQINRETAKKGIQVNLTVNNGQCTDLFNNEGANHWFCKLHFSQGEHWNAVILDPSFRRIVSPSKYLTFDKEQYSSEVNIIDRETDTEVRELNLNDLRFGTIAFACSFDLQRSYGLSFHGYNGKVIPVLSIFWDKAVGEDHRRADIFINPTTGKPMCDRRIIPTFSLAERIEIVQCLAEIQKFRIEEGDALPILQRLSTVFASEIKPHIPRRDVE